MIADHLPLCPFGQGASLANCSNLRGFATSTSRKATLLWGGGVRFCLVAWVLRCGSRKEGCPWEMGETSPSGRVVLPLTDFYTVSTRGPSKTNQELHHSIRSYQMCNASSLIPPPPPAVLAAAVAALAATSPASRLDPFSSPQSSQNTNLTRCWLRHMSILPHRE